jgi:hypothetical protein
VKRKGRNYCYKCQEQQRRDLLWASELEFADEIDHAAHLL